MLGFNPRFLRIARHALPLALLVPAAFGISAALQKLAPESAEAALDQPAPASVQPVRRDSGASNSRVALVIGNSEYPDANIPLRQPAEDAQALADALRRNGFDVDMQQNLGKDEMKRAVERFKGRIAPGSVGLISFGGFGIQVGRQSYMIPVDAQIWREADVVRDGISIESLLSDMHRQGADVKVAILDASRRNPFERRFRALSAGLAAIDAPQGTLLLSATAPGKVAYDGDGDHSLLVDELLKEINASTATAEAVFNRTRIGVSRASNGEQVPLVASSLIESFSFSPAAPRASDRYTQSDDARAPRRETAAGLDEGVKDAAVAPAPRIDAGKTNAAATANTESKPAQYQLASRPVDTPVEKIVEKPAVKVIEKPVEKAVEKPVVKETKRARAETRSRRQLGDDEVYEQPRFIRRNTWSPSFHPGRRFGMGFGPRMGLMRGFRF